MKDKKLSFKQGHSDKEFAYLHCQNIKLLLYKANLIEVIDCDRYTLLYTILEFERDPYFILDDIENHQTSTQCVSITLVLKDWKSSVIEIFWYKNIYRDAL